MFSTVKQAFQIPEIRKRILIVLFLIFCYRVVAHIPLPGVDRLALEQLFASSQLLGFVDVFSGGSLSRFSVGAVGLSPYITASIFMQIAVFVIPQLEEMQKEGSVGVEKINRYTKFLTLPFALLQSVGLYFLFQSQGLFTTTGPLDIATIVVVLSTGAFIAMWLGDLITEQNIGQGISILVLVGILASAPQALAALMVAGQSGNLLNLVLFLAIAALVVAGVVFVNDAVRKIPIAYANTRSTSYRGESFLPLKVNQAGVIPIIFAVALALIPSMLGSFILQVGIESLQPMAEFLVANFNAGSLWYNIFYFLLVVAFTFFYTAVTFNPEKVSDDLKQRGGFIPGIRPGRATEEYLNKVLTRITLMGALFLGFVAIIPSIAAAITGFTALTIGGTGILIVVSVVLETMKKLESQVVMREYDQIVLN
jgi:preprotein translocase subunit SecY